MLTPTTTLRHIRLQPMLQGGLQCLDVLPVQAGPATPVQERSWSCGLVPLSGGSGSLEVLVTWCWGCW